MEKQKKNGKPEKLLRMTNSKHESLSSQEKRKYKKKKNVFMTQSLQWNGFVWEEQVVFRF